MHIKVIFKEIMINRYLVFLLLESRSLSVYSFYIDLMWENILRVHLKMYYYMDFYQEVSEYFIHYFDL